MSCVASRADWAAITPHVAARSTGCSGSVSVFGPQEASSNMLDISNGLIISRPFTHHDLDLKLVGPVAADPVGAGLGRSLLDIDYL